MPSTTLPPPLGGWNTFDGVVGMSAQFAPVLDNWIPEQGRLRVRPGYRTWASGLPGRVDGLMAFRSGSASILFASSGAGIYDVSAPGAVGAPVVAGLTDARVDGLNVAAAGGSFLLTWNGVDVEHVFNGTSWAPWSATGIPGRISWATVFKAQLFAGRRDRLSFWYSIPGAIGGAFTEFPLQGVAKRGGGLVGAIGWTLDSGQGPDDRLALFTSEGEVIVYAGFNPSSTETWSLVGVFSMAHPIGSRFLRQFGGGVLVLTDGGVFPLSAVVSGTDEAALASKAFTRLIEPSFLEQAAGTTRLAGWDLVSITSLGLWIINQPLGTTGAQQVVFRAASGACARLLGIPAACWIDTSAGAFFGHSSTGKVLIWGRDVSDDGAPIAAECVTAFSEFRASGKVKQFTLAMPYIGDEAGASVRVSMALDYVLPPVEAYAPDVTLPVLPGDPMTLTWGEGLWGVARWGGGMGWVTRRWRTVQGIGQAGAVRLRASSSVVRPSWLGTGVVWVRGDALR